jgi:hypothetical protein
MPTNDADELLNVLTGTSICNFCGAQEPLVRYVVEDTSWLACGPCASLIAQKNIEGSFLRAKSRLNEAWGDKVGIEVIDTQIRKNHMRFWKSWQPNEEVARMDLNPTRDF